MKKRSIIFSPIPTIGMGATIHWWSDRSATTIIQISGNKIVLQKDFTNRINANGVSDSQEYEYSPNENGAIYIATKRKDGTYRLVGTKILVRLDIRSEYFDFSF